MKIDNISLINFRQYYGNVSIDLQTNGSKNIILIGGKNGYGKTNFLIALVWCFYGEKISQVDETFKKEIQKDINYSKFIKQCLNWDAQSEGTNKFSIQLAISDIEMPENSLIPFGENQKCIIKREYDVQSMNETLSIVSADSLKEIFDSEEEKANFINNYLIPIEIAKFVFFDAEKIASLAELSTKEEASIFNDALGKLLGLDIYKNLEDDLKIYTDTLKKEEANINIREQLTNSEKTVDLNSLKINSIDEKIAQNENTIVKKKEKIREYNDFLNSNAQKNELSYNREKLLETQKQLEQKASELANRFNELSEIIPLAMLAGKLDEVAENLYLEEQNRFTRDNTNEMTEKIDLLVEQIFNQPPYPENTQMSIKHKIFYSQKFQEAFNAVFSNKETITEIDFEHDLSNSDKELVFNAINSIKQQSKAHIEQTIETYNNTQNDLYEITQLLRKVDANLEDEITSSYIIEKEEEERKVEKLIAENGVLANQKEELIKQNHKENQRYQVLLQKIHITEKRRKKLEKANLYIATLQEFIVSQKKRKKDSLSNNIYAEMQKLMHKLQEGNDSFITKVNVDILPDDSGLKVTLYDKEGKIYPKESLSQGEKQLYISSLIKSLLLEAIQDMPIFIDTPLGRLDDNHIRNILLYYYPDLAEQVIILATNNEITPKRYQDLKDNIAKSYTLNLDTKKTTFKKGYFQNYEN